MTAPDEPIAQRLGRWAAGLRLDDVPERVRAAARLCIADTIGVTAAGSGREPAASVRRHARAVFAPGPCSMVGDEARLSPPAAALSNGVAAHLLDFDDTSYEGILHGSAVVWPAVMAAAEAADCSGADLLAAFIAGVEVEYALGGAMGDASYERGWWTTGLLGTIGAAVGAARALGLDAERTAHAIAIAACQTAGLRAIVGTPVKPLACGRTAQAGVEAALLAAAGIAAPALAFEHRSGFFSLHAEEALPADAFAGLGTHYRLTEPGIAFKLYPVCSAAQAAIEACRDILEQERVTPDRVSRVLCEVTPLVAISLIYDRPQTVTQAQFSMPFAIACVLVFGRLGAEHLDMTAIADPRIGEAMKRVEMVTTDALTATPEDRLRNPEGAIVTVFGDDGRSWRRVNGAATGMPARPASPALLERKFRDCVGPLIGSEQCAALLGRIGAIDQLARASDLLRPLCVPTLPG